MLILQERLVRCRHCGWQTHEKLARGAKTLRCPCCGRIIRLPAHFTQILKKYSYFSHQLTQKLGRDPHIREIADVMELP